MGLNRELNNEMVQRKRHNHELPVGIFLEIELKQSQISSQKQLEIYSCRSI